MMPADLPHLMGATVLLLSFALLMQRRIAAVISILAVQAMVLAALSCWQGFVQGSAQLYLTGLVTLAAQGVAIPRALYRIVRQRGMDRTIRMALGLFPAMVLGVVLVALSIMVVTPTMVPTREDLALALSVVLLAMLVMVTRGGALMQVAGFLSLGNGLILAAIGVAGLPLLAAVSVAVLGLVAMFGIFAVRVALDDSGRVPR